MAIKETFLSEHVEVLDEPEDITEDELRETIEGEDKDVSNCKN